jgi:excisionase family DNA binding protein
MEQETGSVKKQLLTVKEVAEIIGAGVPTVKRWYANGKFPQPRKRLGRFTRWHIDDVEAWINGEWKAAS